MLFRKKLSASLKQRGFVTNPYEWCVTNKDIKEKQCTIVWHADDLKVSHADSVVVDKVVASLQVECGQLDEMIVRRKIIHDCLETELDFSSPGKFVIDMEDYHNEVRRDLPGDMIRVVSTPATHHIL